MVHDRHVSDDVLTTKKGLRLDPAAFSWQFSRASGPGGQHVNTTESRVELRCDLALTGLPAHLQERIAAKLGTTDLRVISATHRSQRRNRDDALARLGELVDAASVAERKRRPTRPGRGAVERRLGEKKRGSERKTDRRWRPDE